MCYQHAVSWLNYHHLHYFWLVVREGGVVPAAKKLRVSHPTVSTQLRKLEESLGESLFDRSRRRLELTDVGKVAYEYAEQIFALGAEMQGVLQGQHADRPLKLAVGVTDAMPKLIVRRLLEPALRLEAAVRLLVREDRTDRVLAELALGNLDVVLADTPVPSGSGLRAYSHQLGECGITFFAEPRAARRLRSDFPASLSGAPFLAPTGDYVLRRELELWFDKVGARPEIVAEFEDSALLKVFAQDGLGAFAAPTVIADAIEAQYGVRRVGATEEVRERFYAITLARRLDHGAVRAICEAARDELFAARG
jgi:LysR family transcriptional activator of nhaA